MYFWLCTRSEARRTDKRLFRKTSAMLYCEMILNLQIFPFISGLVFLPRKTWLYNENVPSMTSSRVTQHTSHHCRRDLDCYFYYCEKWTRLRVECLKTTFAFSLGRMGSHTWRQRQDKLSNQRWIITATLCWFELFSHKEKLRGQSNYLINIKIKPLSRLDREPYACWWIIDIKTCQCAMASILVWQDSARMCNGRFTMKFWTIGHLIWKTFNGKQPLYQNIRPLYPG